MQDHENPNAIDSTENQMDAIFFEEADKLRDEGKYEEAFDIYKAYREKHISSKEGLEAETDITLNENMGNCLMELSRHQEAKTYLVKAAELQNIFDPNNKLEILRIKLDCAKIYMVEEDSDNVQSSFETCLELLNQIPKTEKELIGCYNRFALLCLFMKKHDEALHYANDAVEINKSLIDSNDDSTPDLADSLTVLGNIHFSLNQFIEAYDCFSTSLKIQSELKYPKNNPDALLLYEMLGTVNIALKNYGEALEHLQNLLKYRKELYGEHHFTFSKTYYDIGIARFELGYSDEALESLNKSLDAHKKSFGEKPNENSGLIYELRGKISFLQQNYLGAIKNYEDALQANKQVFGEDSIEVSNNYHQLGDLYLDRWGWKPGQAELNLNKAFQIRLKYPDNKLLIAESESKLASLYASKHQFYKSLTIQMKSMKTRRTLTEDYSRESVECMFELSDLLDKMEDLSSCESGYKRIHLYDKVRDDLDTDYETNESLIEIEQQKCLTDLNKFEI